MPGENIDIILRLLNSRRFQAGMGQAAASVKLFSREIEASNAASTRWASAQRAAAGSMYLIGAASRTVGQAIGIAGIATVGFGLKFNATMEQNTLAFEKFTGGADSARKLLHNLFEVAASTPFTFKDITTATRRLLAFGFNAKEAASWMKTLGDTISYTGGSADDIMRAVKAIGEIKGIGRLQQRQILQLTNLGVNAHDILTKNLGLTEKQLHNIGRAGIDAQDALSALQKGFNQRYGGGAAKYSKTFVGQLEKAKDYFERAAGDLTKPLFNYLEKHTLPGLVKIFEGVSKWAGSGGMQKIFAKVGPSIGGAFKGVVGYIHDFINALKPAQPFLQNVMIPLIKGLAEGLIFAVGGALKGILPFIKIWAYELGFVGKILKPFKKIIELVGFALSFVFGGEILDAIASLGRFGGLFRYVGFAARVVLVPFRVFWGTIGLISRALGFAAGLLFRFAMRWSPLARVVSALIGPVTRLGGVVRKWIINGFATAVSRVAKFVEAIAGLGGRVMEIGGKIGDFLFIGMRKKILKLFLGAGAMAASIGRGIADWLNKNTPFGDNVDLGVVHFKIPALAGGGHITSGGYALVGERGPELVSLPAGSSVAPMRPARARRPSRGTGAGKGTSEFAGGGGAGFAGLSVHVDVPVHLDKRQIGMAMGDYVAERKARR